LLPLLREPGIFVSWEELIVGHSHINRKGYSKYSVGRKHISVSITLAYIDIFLFGVLIWNSLLWNSKSITFLSLSHWGTKQIIWKQSEGIQILKALKVSIGSEGQIHRSKSWECQNSRLLIPNAPDAYTQPG
jgi:hypothetical protein